MVKNLILFTYSMQNRFGLHDCCANKNGLGKRIDKWIEILYISQNKPLNVLNSKRQQQRKFTSKRFSSILN